MKQFRDIVIRENVAPSKRSAGTDVWNVNQ